MQSTKPPSILKDRSFEMSSIYSTSSLARRATAAAALLSLAVTLGACSAPASGSPTPAAADQVTNLKIGAANSLTGVGLRAAMQEGDFKANGLTVTPVANKSANDAVPQLLSGDLQVAQLDTLTFMQARSQGIPLKIVAGAGEQSTDGGAGVPSTGSVVVAENSTIHSALDLVGKKVGVPAIKTQVWMNIRDAVDKAGGDSSKINFVEVPPAQTIDLVQKGDVDAATPNEPLASSSIAAGKVKLVINSDAPGNKGVPSSVYVSTEDFIAKNPDTVKKFAQSVYKAAAQINGNRDLAVKIAEEQLNYKPEQMKNAFVATFSTGPVQADKLDAIAGLALKYGILTEKPKAADLLAVLK
ncbi:hypothetical protein B5P43_35250 [Bacillus sp. SRB_336]|nr:hypothetical protein B5P43_35250 [Bacillus sp. SRB_336]